jgi:hypothetical protein
LVVGTSTFQQHSVDVYGGMVVRSGVTTISTSLDVNGNADISGITTIGSTLDVNGNADISGITTISGTLRLFKMAQPTHDYDNSKELLKPLWWM